MLLMKRMSAELTTLPQRVLAARGLRICNQISYCKHDSDDEKELKKQKKSKQSSKESDETASARLNRLLASMATDDNNNNTLTQTKPGEAHKKRKEEAKENLSKNDIFEAAKRVASLLGEEHKKQTESELLSKLLGRANLQTKDTHSEKVEENNLNLSDIIVGMKIDRRQQPKEEETRGEFVRRTLTARAQHQKQFAGTSTRSGGRMQQHRRQETRREAETYTGSVNLFGGAALDIFKEPAKLKESQDILTTWQHLQQRELKLQVTHPPANYFEKMALWTEQGKIWRFPIDNEQDMHEEAEVDFSEHIFLEQHLESWCPTRGPVRHFMELVCVGLSKNPYISARDKKEHILWYRDYFESKRDILKELMNTDKLEKFSESEKKLQA